MNLPAPHRDPVPALAREVIDLYAEALASVRFPDLDITVLEGMSQELGAAQCEVERLEAELEAARNRLQIQADSLVARAQRALAYARVFAEGDPTLSARVAEIRGEEPSARRDPIPPKRRARTRKSETGNELFDDNMGTESELAEHAA